ncbi:MAG: hypothetical protein ACTMHH_04000 [Nesterenkonia sp.]
MVFSVSNSRIEPLKTSWSVRIRMNPGAKSRLQSQRRAEFSESHVAPLVREVRLLHIHKDELAEMIDKEGSK